jgi:intein/homing endonuclease
MKIKFSKKYKPLFDILQGKNPEVDTVIITGGRGCFYENQEVVTNKENKPISKIEVGDFVLSYNEKTKENVFKRVLNTFKYSNKKLYVIRLKNGTTIKVTENHKFYYNGCWIEIKDLLSLFYGNMETNS